MTALSLLRGLGEKEVKSYGRKGLFTLTNWDNIFRPRRKSNRAERGSSRRYHALQAMAIRDKTVDDWNSENSDQPCTYLLGYGG